MTTPVNKIIQSLESILEQCKDKKELSTHNQIKDSSIYYEGMVDVLNYVINSFKDFFVQDKKQNVYLVFKEEGVDGIDIDSVQVFQEQKDAIAYSIALETHKYYNKDYHTVRILLKEII